jgi:ketosteroid isomerase-like protein
VRRFFRRTLEQFRSDWEEVFMLKALMITTSLAVLATATAVRAEDFKSEAEKMATAYTACIAKHDAACVASLYSKDGVQINPVGAVKTDIKATYEENFKNGEETIAPTVNYAERLGNDMAVASGDVDITFNVEPKQRALFWSATYVKEGGQWKIRMLTAGIKPPPPPKEANADKK